MSISMSLLSMNSEPAKKREEEGVWETRVELLKIGRTLSSSRAEVGGRRQTDGQSFLPWKNAEAF